MIATIENMEKCKNIPGVFMLSGEGDEYSANPGDYFWTRPRHVFLDSDGEPCVLVTRHCTIEEVTV